jgi:hypothetical protein
MHDSAPEDGWLQVGLDDDGAPLFVDLKSVRTRGGLRLDRLEVTVIVKPANESDGFRALQELLSKAGKSCDELAYVEQYWVLHLPEKLFRIDRLSVKRKDGHTLHSVTLSNNDLTRAEPGSAAEHVCEAVERLIQDQSVVLHMPDADVPAERARIRISPEAGPRRDVTHPDPPRHQTGSVASAVHRVAFSGIWARFLRRLRG